MHSKKAERVAELEDSRCLPALFGTQLLPSSAGLALPLSWPVSQVVGCCNWLAAAEHNSAVACSLSEESFVLEPASIP